MTMGPEHIDLHRMVDRLDPDQVRALRAVAQQLLRSAADTGPLPSDTFGGGGRWPAVTQTTHDSPPG